MSIDQTLLSAVIELVSRVGEFQNQHFRSPDLQGHEKMARELVSNVDLQSEEQLKEGLLKLLPEAGFYGEESGESGSESLRWIVDPLDGTTNFLSGLDQYSISVALEQDQRPLLGVVYRPQSQECFSALRGQGLRHNGDLCPALGTNKLRHALIGTGFPYRSPDLAAHFFACSPDVLYRCRGLRRFASAALDLSYVAAGFLQGFWESDLQPYDVAAALLFLEENGCCSTNQRGELFNVYRDRLLVCAPPGVHAELLECVAKHYPADI